MLSHRARLCGHTSSKRRACRKLRLLYIGLRRGSVRGRATTIPDVLEGVAPFGPARAPPARAATFEEPATPPTPRSAEADAALREAASAAEARARMAANREALIRTVFAHELSGGAALGLGDERRPMSATIAEVIMIAPTLSLVLEPEPKDAS